MCVWLLHCLILGVRISASWLAQSWAASHSMPAQFPWDSMLPWLLSLGDLCIPHLGSPWEGPFGSRAWPIQWIEFCRTAPQGKSAAAGVSSADVEESVYGPWIGNLTSSLLAAPRGAETPLLPWGLGNSSTKFSHLWLLSCLIFFRNLHRENLISFAAECSGILEWFGYDNKLAIHKTLSSQHLCAQRFDFDYVQTHTQNIYMSFSG